MIIVAVLVCLLVGCSETVETVVAASVSPGGGVVVEVRAGEAWTYGPHPIKIVKVSGGKEELLEKMELRNDGAVLGSRNAKIEWVDDTHLLVTLDGQEQEPKTYSYEI